MSSVSLPVLGDDPLRVERVSEQNFPFDQAGQFENCPWMRVGEMRFDLIGNGTIFLVASAMRRKLDNIVDSSFLISDIAVTPPNAPLQPTMVGFLLARLATIEEGTKQRAELIDVVASLLDDTGRIEDALVERWQNECRRNAWEELRVDVPNENPDDPVFLRHDFKRIHNDHPLAVDWMIWRPEKQSA